MGYVLPYGQMSLWGATVITNLLSAIPWLGKSLVEFVWGGLCRIRTSEELNECINFYIFVIIILFFAGISCKYKYFIEYGFSYCIKYVKKSIKMRLPAEILKLKYSTFSSISQRLESRDFIYPYLVGLIEGDGWFSISKKGKYIMYELGIELSIRDVQLIYKIKSLLGVGTISFRTRDRQKNKKEQNENVYNNVKINNKNNMIIYRIKNKSHLKNIIIPIFDKYPFFTDKQYDYVKFRTFLLNDVIYSKDLINYNETNIYINTVESITNTSYFPAWLIGFIEAESSFSIYKPTNDNSFIASFEISQTNNDIIILAIKKYLKLSQNITKDKTNNFKIKVSNIRSIENVIKFMEKAPIKLLGYKKLQYNIWLKKLRKIPRYYNKINIPFNY